MTLLAPTLEAFFSERLIGQLNVSPHTVAAYRPSVSTSCETVRAANLMN